MGMYCSRGWHFRQFDRDQLRVRRFLLRGGRGRSQDQLLPGKHYYSGDLGILLATQGLRAKILILTSALVTISHPSRSTIVASTDNPLLADYDTTHTPLHAIASMSCQICQPHKVLIPGGSKTCFVGYIQNFERVVEQGE